MKRILLTLAVVLASLASFAGDDDIGPVAHLHFVVVRAYNGKPVRNAPVVMHFVSEKGKQERGGLELKTDADGRANYEGVPYGKLRVQVLARGFQTFGADYEINQPTMEITVRLNRPSGQYSIYEEHPGEKPPEEKKPEEKKDETK
jgi:hypothetical protein